MTISSSPPVSDDSVTWTKEQARYSIKVWLNETVKPNYSSVKALSRVTGIDVEVLHTWFSWQRRKAPDVDALEKIESAISATAPPVVWNAVRFLHPVAAPEPDPMAADIVRNPLATTADVSNWVRYVRTHRRAGKLSLKALSDAIGRSIQTQLKWEDPEVANCPTADDIQKIADVCRFPVPIVQCALRPGPTGSPQYYFPPAASSLAEEIQNVGRALSMRCYRGSMVERNTMIFMDRFGCSGIDASTLQAIGDKVGITRERVRMVVDKQMEFLGTTKLDTSAFDALSAAVQQLDTSLTLSEAEATLRPLLGGTLSLEGAIDYGIVLLGKRLQIQITRRRGQEALVSPGMTSEWISAAISCCNAVIRHNGAAMGNLVWAMTMREIEDFIPYDAFIAVVATQAGFQWLDEAQTWFWFGPDATANRVMDRAIVALTNAKQPLDIEVVYGGIVRQGRTPWSNIAAQAASWPPINIVAKLLASHPSFKCTQFNDFSLTAPVAFEGDQEDRASAAAIVDFMAENDGIASRWEINDHLLSSGRYQQVTLSLALATSPMIVQLERGVFAIRGWPLNVARLEEAQASVGGSHTNTSVTIEDGPKVTWEGTLTEGALRNRVTHLPAKARPHVPEGRYQAGHNKELVVIEDRVGGLVGYLSSLGAQAGWSYRVTFDIKSSFVSATTSKPREWTTDA